MSQTQNIADLAKYLFGLPGAASPEEMAALAREWMTEDVTLHYPGSAPIPFAKVWKGRKGFTEFVKTFFDAVEIIEMPATGFSSDGNRAFIEGNTTARVRATGKVYKSAWLLVWTFENRKVTKMVEYHDTQAVAEAFR
jgi:ketosteroid isomerase-like protein